MADYELNINTDKVLEGLNDAVLRALERIGGQAEGYAFDLCPARGG